MAKKNGVIKKYTILAIICLLTFTSFWLIFNVFQTKPTESTVVVGRYALASRILLSISPFLLALTIAGLYIFWKRAKPPVIIKTVSERPPGVEGIYEGLKVLKDDEKLVISTITRSGGKILQKELTAITKLPSYKITRILNRLERLGVVTREKYGMTNIIHLKFDSKKMPEL